MAGDFRCLVLSFSKQDDKRIIHLVPSSSFACMNSEHACDFNFFFYKRKKNKREGNISIALF